MALLYDKVRKKPVNVADNLVNEAIASGNYEFRSGVRVPVVAPNGEEGTVLSDELPSLMGKGFKYLTQEEGAQRAKAATEQIKAIAYDKPATAFAAGALRGATLGLSDVAAVGLGKAAGVDVQEALRETQARSPIASTVGEVAGGIGALLTPTGAAGSLGAAGRVLSAPARMAVQAGEQVAARAGANIFARAGAAGVTEGAILGVGQTISEAALGDPDLTVQKAVGNIGLGAVLGGGVNLAGRGILEVGNKAITGGLSQLSKSEAIPKTAKEFAGWLSEKYGKAVNLVRADIQADEIGSGLWERGNAEFRKEVVEHMADPQQLYRKIASNFDTVRDFSDDLEKVTGKAAKIQKEIIDENIGQITPMKIEKLDDDIAEEFGTEFIATRPTLQGKTLAEAEKVASTNKFDSAWAKARSIVDDMDKMRVTMQEQNAKHGTMIDPGSIAEINKITDDLSMTLQSSRKISEISDALVKAKSQLADTTSIFNKPKELMSPVELRTKKALLPLWKSLKEASVDTEIFGDLGAALAQRADSLNILRNAVQDFDKQFFTYTKNNKGQWQRTEDYAKISNFFVNPQTPSKEKKRLAMAGFSEAVDETIDALKPIPLKNIDDEIANLEKVKKQIVNQKQVEFKEKKLEFLENKITRLQEQNKKISAFNDEIAQTIAAAKERKLTFDKSIDLAESQRAAVAWLNAKESFTGKSLHGAILGGLAAPTVQTLTGSDSTLSGGLLGALGGAILGNPRAGLKFIYALENAAGGLDKMATNAAKRFKNLDTALTKEGGVRRAIGTGVKQSFIREKLRIDGNTQEDNEKAFEKHREDLSKLQSNPTGLYERIHDNIGDEGVESAPAATFALFDTAIRAANFLETKIPKDPYAQGLYPDKFTPSFVELDRYANYSRAVMKPKTILKELENGNLKAETVEAVKAVYPKMYEAVVAAVSTEMLEEKKMSYQKRIQLGILFDIPTVKALQPDYLARMMSYHAQANAEENAPEQGAQMGRSQMVSFRNLKTSEREQRV